MHAPILHQCAKVAHEQRAQQRGNVRAIGVRVGENTYLSVAQTIELARARVDTQRDSDVMHLL